MLTIFMVFMATIVSRLHACSFTGWVNMTSDKLLMTCECKVPHTDLPITLIQLVMVNEKTHHKHQSFLASLQGDQVNLDKYSQNYDVVDTKLTAREAVFTLEFDAQRKYEFNCTITGMNDRLNTLSKTYYFEYHPADTTTTPTAKPTTTITRSDPGKNVGPQDESSTGERISSGTLTIIIIVSLLVIVIGLVVVFITATCRRRRSSTGHPPRPPNDAVPLEMVMSLLQAVTPSHVRGHRHVTPTDSCLSLSNGINPSGSYAVCDPSTSSGHDVILPLLRHHNEYTTNLLSNGVTGHATVRKTVYGDDTRRSDSNILTTRQDDVTWHDTIRKTVYGDDTRSDSKMLTSREDDVTGGSTLDRDGKENHQYGNEEDMVLGGRGARVGERRTQRKEWRQRRKRDARLERHRSSDSPYLTPGFTQVEL
ncbi:uncharacterized protein [Littorina saxatilis]|uniref:uncharacterized protein n=1 Tax=Littorina saxatilis TaxID=31220 RepID=UPI0038B4AD7A